MQGLNRIENATVHNGQIDIGIPVEEIAEKVSQGEMYIVKGVFDPNELRAMTEEVFHSFDGVDPSFTPYEWGIPNSWRVDDNPPKSTRPKEQALYFCYLWNEEFPKVRKIAGMLHSLRNKINGLPTEYGLHEEDDHWAVPLFQHYPVGGGFICEHDDPLEPQKCVVSLTLIKDFEKGGLYGNPSGSEKIPLDPYIEPGDLFIFRPDVLHGVAPIDPHLSKDYRSLAGRWRMACIYSERSERYA